MKNSIRSAWKEMPFSHRVVTLLQLLAAIVIVTLVILQLTGVWRDAGNVYIPLLAITNYCSAFLQWKTARSAAIFSLICAGLITACAVGIMVISLVE